MSIGLQGTDTATQQNTLELLHMAYGGSHPLKDSSSRARLLPTGRRSASDGRRCRVCEVSAVGKTGLRTSPGRAPGSGRTGLAPPPGSMQLISTFQNLLQ